MIDGPGSRQGVADDCTKHKWRLMLKLHVFDRMLLQRLPSIFSGSLIKKLTAEQLTVMVGEDK